jgi:hypothetical protein
MSPPYAIKAYGVEVLLHTFLTSTLRGEWLASRLSSVIPEKAARGIWVGPAAYLDASKRSLALPGIEPRLLDRPARSLVTTATELPRLTYVHA